MTDENLLIIELIREWLVFNQLSSSNSVFMAETGAPAMPLDRPELATLVGVVDDAQSSQLCVRTSVWAVVSDSLACVADARTLARLLRPLLYELVERSRMRHALPPPLPPTHGRK